jgi:hypothetical protein
LYSDSLLKINKKKRKKDFNSAAQPKSDIKRKRELVIASKEQ